jgi:hypothetical protein
MLVCAYRPTRWIVSKRGLTQFCNFVVSVLGRRRLHGAQKRITNKTFSEGVCV